LEQAGWRTNGAVIAYLFVKVSLPLTAGLFSVVFLYGLEAYALQPMTRLLVSLGLVLGAFYAPEIYVRNAADKRRAKLRRGLPDVLDLMVICAEAGLSLDATLQRVARELAPVHPELSEEIQLTSIELGFLPDRRKALENLARRTALQQISGVVNTLSQTEKYGTPLADSLRVLAAEFRNERLIAAETKAAKLPATLTVPMVLFIMPVLFVVLLGTAVLRTIDSLGGL
jgi:tight adherence protein C